MTVIWGLLYLIIVGFGGWLIVRAQSSCPLTPADLWVCRLLTVFALFFFAFDVLGAFGVFFPGRSVTFPNAVVVTIAVSAAAYALARHDLPQTMDDVGAQAMRQV